jgi:hypothetical protein
MRIGEEVLAVLPRRRSGDSPYDEKRRSDAGSDRWPNEVMCASAKCAILMRCTVQMKVSEL